MWRDGGGGCRAIHDRADVLDKDDPFDLIRVGFTPIVGARKDPVARRSSIRTGRLGRIHNGERDVASSRRTT